NVLYRLTAGGSATNLYANVLAALPYAPFVGDHLATVQLLANGDLWVSDLFEFTLKSTDNGDHFTRKPMTLTGPLPRFVRPGTTTIEGGRNGLVQDPTNPSRLFLGGGYAPFRSDDGGETWRYMTAGIGETVAWRASFHPTDPNRIWFPLADLGATTVSDAGASGASNGYISYHFPYPDDNVVFTHRLLVSANKVIAPGGEQASHHPRIYQTTDNGANWTKLAMTGLPDEYGREILEAVASSDNADDFLVFTAGVIDGNAGGVYRTTNGGANFTRASGLPVGYDPGAEFYWNVSLERDANNVATRYLLLRNSGFWKSTDRGVTWTKPNVQPNNAFGRLRVDPTNGRIWVGTVIGLEYSDNGGASWTLLNGAFTSVTELDAHGGRLAVIGRRSGDTFDRIYYSRDNGARWGEITRPGNRFAKTEQVTVDPWRPGTVWISTGGRSIARFDAAPLEAAGVFSSKTHGQTSFLLQLPTTGTSGVECRGTTGNHTLVFAFTSNVVNSAVTLSTQKGGTISGNLIFSEGLVTVNLSGVVNEQTITLTLSNIVDEIGQTLPSSAVSVRMLTGDTNGDGSVNSGDSFQTRGRSGLPLDQNTFRSDVNVDGSVNSGDAFVVRSRSGTAVP
ncbi:MAG TPA: hypothetical protein VF683_08990, partial [Chthoniobacterales bacterium]